MKKKLFIDCGTANFTGLQHFKKLYSFTGDNTKIICFEANPITYKSYPIPNSLKNLDIEHYNLAVSNLSILLITLDASPDIPIQNSLKFTLPSPPVSIAVNTICKSNAGLLYYH